MNELTLVMPNAPNEIALAEHAAVIRALGKRVVGDIIEIGRRLSDAKRRVGHGGWLPWLEREFGWVEQTALNFMRCHDLAKSKKFGDLNLPVSGLYLLAAPTTPDEARDSIIERARDGEALTHAQVKAMIDEARKKQDADHKADRDREREASERRIERMREQHDRQAKELRDKLAQSLTPDLIEKAIDEAVGPLKKKIERYEKALEDKKSRVPIEHAGPASAIKGALRHFSNSLTITPDQLVQSQKQIAKLTRQSARETLAEDVANAKTAIAWLRGFVKEWEALS